MLKLKAIGKVHIASHTKPLTHVNRKKWNVHDGRKRNLPHTLRAKWKMLYNSRNILFPSVSFTLTYMICSAFLPLSSFLHILFSDFLIRSLAENISHLGNARCSALSHTCCHTLHAQQTRSDRQCSAYCGAAWDTMLGCACQCCALYQKVGVRDTGFRWCRFGSFIFCHSASNIFQ